MTLQTTTLNLANCICQHEFVDPKTEKSLPDSWSLRVYIYTLVVKRKLIIRSCTFVAKQMSLSVSVYNWNEGNKQASLTLIEVRFGKS